ncbi:hypothetical protein PMAYCL1PPCAC_11837, partial [Pristionchus mayeri]
IEKLKSLCGFDHPKMNPPANSSAVNVNQSPINYEANVTYIENLWNERFCGKDKHKYEIDHRNPIRAEYHKLFSCLSRCQKILKRIAKEKRKVNEVILCKEVSIPYMKDLIENLSNKISPIDPFPFMWNHEAHLDVIRNLNLKWDELEVHDFLDGFPADEESDNEIPFEDKYGIVKTKFLDVSMRSVVILFNEFRAINGRNGRLKNELHALEREEKQLHRMLQEECADLLMPFSSLKMTVEIPTTLFALAPGSSSSRASAKSS